MNKQYPLFTAMFFLSMISFNAAAGDAVAGKAVSSTCTGCHGVNGISTIPIYPNLAGQKAQYLEVQLKAFRDGSRKDPVMGTMAKSLSDSEISDLAAYFSSL